MAWWGACPPSWPPRAELVFNSNELLLPIQSVDRSVGLSDAAVAVLRTPYARTRHESVKLDRVAPATTRQQRRRRWQFPTYDREQGLDLRYLRRTHWKGELFLVFDHWSSDFSCHWSGSGHDLFVLSMQFPCNTKID